MSAFVLMRWGPFEVLSRGLKPPSPPLLEDCSVSVLKLGYRGSKNRSQKETFVTIHVRSDGSGGVEVVRRGQILDAF